MYFLKLTLRNNLKV